MNIIRIGDKRLKMVPPGKMDVTTGNPEILASSLGSCVGLALLDKQRKIGGLIHVVLPRSSSKLEEVLNICAENALGLLLERMFKAGAKKEHIVAGICGGFSSRFPWIDNYGIESVKIIKGQLKDENIPLMFLEPLEHLLKSFVVDVKDNVFACRDIFLEGMHPRKTKEDTPVKIEDVLLKIKPIPVVVLKIIDLLSSANFNINEVVQEVKKDEVITAKLIKYCNSPVFSPVKKIDSIEKAVIFLGSRNLLKTILSVYMEDFYGDSPGYSLRQNGMYSHTWSVAFISQKLAEELDLSGDVAYTCGLLHDIGKRALDFYMDRHKYEYYQRMIIQKDSLYIEKEIFGFDHCEIGEKIAQKWNFPENIKDVIRNHHSVSDDMDSIAKVVYLSNILAHHFLPGFVIGGSSLKGFEQVMKDLGLTYSNLTKIMENIPYTIFTQKP